MSALYKIFVTNIIAPDNFFGQIGTGETFQYFKELEDNCEELGLQHSSSIRLPSNEPQEGQGVIAYSTTLKKWARAKIFQISDDDIDVSFVDYEITELLEKEKIICDIPKWVHETHPIAFKCKLYGIRPLTKKWITRATTFLKNNVQCQLLDVQIIGAENQSQNRHMPLQVDILVLKSDGAGYISVSDLLKEEGLAIDEKPPMKQNMELSVDKKENKQNQNEKLVASPEIKAFDLALFTMGPKREPETAIAEPDSIEQEIFMEGLGQSYQQYQDNKITAVPFDEGLHNSAAFAENDIAQQLREMKSANKRADLDKQRAHASNAPISDKRVGIGRGGPPPSHILPPSFCDEMPRYVPKKTHSPKPFCDSPPPGSQSRLRKTSSGSCSSTASSVRNSPAAGSRQNVPKQNSPVHRGYKKGINPGKAIKNLTDEQLKNELEWQEHQLSFRIAQIIMKVTTDEITLADGIEELHKVIYPEQSKFENLPGENNEFNLSVETLCLKAVEGNNVDIVVQVLQSLSGDSRFNNVLSNILYKLQNTHIKEYEIKSDRKRAEGYATLLAQLYIHSENLEDSCTVLSCVSTTLEKWSGIQRPQKNVRYLEEVYVDCLVTFFTNAGPVMEIVSSFEVERVFTALKDKVKDKELPKSIKGKLFELIQLRGEGSWGVLGNDKRSEKEMQLPEPSINDVNKSDESKLSAAAKSDKILETIESENHFGRKKTELDNDEKTLHVSVQTQENSEKGVVTRKHKGRIEIKEELYLQNSGQEISSIKIAKVMLDKDTQACVMVEDKCVQTVCEQGPSPSNDVAFNRKPKDKYYRVKKMLLDLELEDLMPAFVEQGIRDTVLNLEFGEVRDLLKESGVKAGQILEIKEYLRNHRHQREITTESECSSPSIYSDTVDSFPVFSSNPHQLEHSSSQQSSGSYVEVSDLKDSASFTRQSSITKTGRKHSDSVCNSTKTLFSPEDFMSATETHTKLFPETPQLSCHSSGKVDGGVTLQSCNVNSNDTIENAASRLPHVEVLSRPPPGFSAKKSPPGMSSSSDISNTSRKTVNYEDSCDNTDKMNEKESRMIFNHDRGDNILQLSADNSNYVKPSVKDSSSVEKQKTHPRSKYNIGGFNSSISKWLTEDNVGPGGEQLQDCNDNVVLNTQVHELNTEVNKADAKQEPYGHIVMSPSSYMPPSPRDDSFIGDCFPSIHDTRSSPRKPLESSPRKLPESKKWMNPKSVDVTSEHDHTSDQSQDFPTLSEAKARSMSKSNAQDKTGATGDSKEFIQKYRTKNNIIDKEVLEQRITQFGSQLAMCSICGERGNHKTHECPKYSPHNLFF